MIADLPQSVAGATINRFCGSSMQAIHSAAGAIALGAGDVFICAGVESMSRVPMMGFNPMPNPALNDRLPRRLYLHGHDGGECRQEIRHLTH
jgi:acetyl-CoA acyltransferase